MAKAAEVAALRALGFSLAQVPPGVSGLGLVRLVFEAVSALGTVGSTTGITPTLDDAGRLILIGAMFVGRLGPLTLVLALAARSRPDRFRPALETIRIG